MHKSIFLEVEFLALVVFSIVLPTAILAGLLVKKIIARATVFVFGVLLIALGGVDFFLLRRLASMASHTVSLFDDRLFGGTLSVALYLLPVIFAGIGTNLVSHVLIQHLTEAEKKFDEERSRS